MRPNSKGCWAIMPTCAIWGCNNGSGREKPREDGRIRLKFWYKHTEAKKEWRERINRENYTPNDHTVICEDHFTEDAYVPDEENVDSKNRKRKMRRLKPKAYPTRNLPTVNNLYLPPEPKRRGRAAHNILKPVENIPTSSIKDSDLRMHNYAKVPVEIEDDQNEVFHDAIENVDPNPSETFFDASDKEPENVTKPSEAFYDASDEEPENVEVKTYLK